MIAEPEHHYEYNMLRQLLDDALSEEQSQLVEAHLGRCERCQSELERIAGDRVWWTETVEVLSESTVGDAHGNTDSEHGCESLDASLDWIRPLLFQSKDGLTHANGIGRLGQYSVQGVIGQGGMGVVLSAIDCELNRPVAMKVLSPHLAGIGASRTRFMREAQAAAAIVHPSVVPIYSIVPTARLPYIVMPRIQGGNLQQRIDHEGPLELTEVLRIGLQVAEGLESAHRQGVIHRDIKPANILIEEGNGRALISDFGLARALDDATLTMSGMIAGTPQYMSPEQASGESIDVRSDLFSLGSLLYALSSGRPPYRAESPLAVLRKISETRPKPVHQVNERLPPWFSSIVGRLMEPNMTRRVGSASEAAELLRDGYAHVRNPSVHAIPVLGSDRMGRRLGATVGALVIITLIAILAYDFFLVEKSPVVSSTNSTVVRKPIANGQLSPAGDSSAWHAVSLETELRSIQARVEEMAASMAADSPDAEPIDAIDANVTPGIASESYDESLQSETLPTESGP